MTAFELGFSPRLIFLSDDDKGRIYQAATQVLEKTGMVLMHENALRLLKEAGCQVEDNNRVRMPERLVEKARRTVPDNISVYDREGDPAMELGGRRAYFGTGSDLMTMVDADGNRHQTSLEDIRRAARMCDALPNIDFIMSFGHPREIEPAKAYLACFQVMVENSTKPIVNTAESRKDLTAIWEISKVLRGGDQPLRDKPYWIQYAEPISPLKHPYDSVDKLLLCAETGMPVIYSPAPIAGSTAPMTIAGHVAQGLAESLFGMVIHQLTVPGAPFIMGMGPAVLDMASSQCSYNAPEYLLAYMAMVEMSKHLNIPNWGYAGTSDAQIPDQQAIFEGGLETFMAAIAGSNLNHDVGYLDFGLAGNLETVVIMDEIIDQVRRIQKGIPVNDEHLAVPVIGEGAAQGEFLTHPHTFKHLRAVQWRPKLLCRNGHEKWIANGGETLLDKARSRVAEILETHHPVRLVPEKDQTIKDIVASYK